ncbi:Alpha/beta hydrolase fold-3 [Lasallia pustulata]|uniref:Alpha/beta hydrolase fold-3 n=1 Tax=Lasallia pustulata TaxID=136370 RepID=A0A1W5D0U5_9LECA|nr:Alpha/beta hydrolase fold-3 [Lasallia pustulata]
MEQIAMHAVEAVVGEDLPRKSTQHDRQEATQEATQGFTVEHVSETIQNGDNPADAEVAGLTPGNTIPGPGHELSIVLDGKMVTIKDQIQMYATNQLISHPLVSPALQPSLGGLPPLLIMTGGGEILRDEQIYIAHKAANPAKFPPGDAYLEEYPEAQDVIAKWKPTDVQLQVWEDLCHVAPTLSFTRPAKYMYRSIAQFGAWTLARAQRTEIDIQDDDAVSVISEESANETDSSTGLKKHRTTAHSGLADHQALSTGKVGKAGDTLPPFQNHMIRQRVDRHGHVYPLGPASSLPGLQMSPNEIGVIKPGPVRKWLEAKTHWDHKYAREKRKVQRQRIKEMARGFDEIGDDEVPPPSALARRRGKGMPKEGKKTKSMGLSLWSLWGSSHDEKTIVREEKADGQHETAIVPPEHGDSPHSADKNKVAAPPISRSRSRSRVVTDQGQTNYIRNPIDATHPSTAHPPQPKFHPHESTASNTLAPLSPSHLSPGQIPPSNTSPPRAAATTTAGSQPRTSSRPTADGVAFPFKLSRDLNPNTSSAGASMITLTSHAGVITPKEGDWSGSRKALEGRTGLEGDGNGVGRVGGQEGERVGGEPEGKGGSGGGEGSAGRVLGVGMDVDDSGGPEGGGERKEGRRPVLMHNKCLSASACLLWIGNSVHDFNGNTYNPKRWLCEPLLSPAPLLYICPFITAPPFIYRH